VVETFNAPPSAFDAFHGYVAAAVVVVVVATYESDLLEAVCSVVCSFAPPLLQRFFVGFDLSQAKANASTAFLIQDNRIR
jgi:hypothetical protein